MALIVVAGDSLWDKFYIGNSLICEKGGGALNTYLNLDDICSQWCRKWRSKIGVITPSPVQIDSLMSYGGTVNYIDGKIVSQDRRIASKVINEFSNITEYYQEENYYALIISDYNRGSVTPDPMMTYCYEPPPWDLIVVDSRHRTVDPIYIRQTPKHCLKVWHCTGNEYDEDFASQFDIVLHTHGPDPVEIKGVEDGTVITVSVPDTPVVNTAGAGDTFVAAWTAHYVMHKDIYKATEFAIAAAQDVIQEPYTAITKHKI